MECPACGQDTPSDVKYCKFCGNALDLDFDKVEASLQVEAVVEADRRFELRARSYLVVAIFVLAIAAGLRVVVGRPPEPVVVPVHLVDEDAPLAPERLDIPARALPIPTE
jgi:hypothetical protein